jgi:hypothetical protein
MSEDQVLIERDSVAQAEEATMSVWQAFVASEAEYVRTYLLDRTRLTAIEQNSVASRYPGGVKTLKVDVTEVIDALCVDVAEYFEGMDRPTVLAGWKSHDPKAKSIVRPFGRFMTGKGFDPGSRSAHPGMIADWYYYGTSEFSDGLQRQGMGMPLAPAHHAYEVSLSPLNEARRALRSHLEVIARNEIDQAWG